MKNKYALIIIAKYPDKDNVMTRLKGSLPDEKRLELYISLLKNTIHKLKEISGVDTFIAYAPSKAHEYFSGFGLKLIPLPEGDLGKRMYHAFSKIFSEGYQKAALVGVDIPELTSSIVLKAFELLIDNDIVFGPAKDGGYYLVGMKTLIKVLFEGVPWSSNQTLKKSMERAQQGGYSVALTEALSDMDTIEDVKRAGFSF